MKKPNEPMRGGKRPLDKGTLKRLLKMLFSYYPVLLPIAIAGIVFSAIASAIPAIFLEQVTTSIDFCLKNRERILCKNTKIKKTTRNH